MRLQDSNGNAYEEEPVGSYSTEHGGGYTVVVYNDGTEVGLLHELTTLAFICIIDAIINMIL